MQGPSRTDPLPPTDSPAYWPVKGLAMRLTAHDYGQQGEMLQTLHHKTSQDVFVGKS